MSSGQVQFLHWVCSEVVFSGAGQSWRHGKLNSSCLMRNWSIPFVIKYSRCRSFTQSRHSTASSTLIFCSSHVVDLGFGQLLTVHHPKWILSCSRLRWIMPWVDSLEKECIRSQAAEIGEHTWAHAHEVEVHGWLQCKWSCSHQLSTGVCACTSLLQVLLVSS